LTPKIQRIFEDENHKLDLYSTKTTQNLFTKLKDKIPVMDKTNEIYKIDCKNCEGKFVSRLINDYLVKIDTKKHHIDNKNTVQYFKFPFIKGLTPKIQRILEDENHKLALYSIKTTQNLFTKLKDKIPVMDKTNLIYKIDCKDCEG
uniref:Uncharacterized protein n=1 Tax=Megaselia scalaris TaxID=36166 RepID=T1GQG2_MEGSC